MPDTASGKLGTLLRPRSIAVVGASASPKRIGSRVLSNLLRHGYAGEVFVISSRHDEVAGLRSHRSLADLDQVPDLALLAVDADTSLEVLAEYATLGGRNAVLLASGFESGGDGQRRSQQLAVLAACHDLNVVGPNTQGLWSAGHKMILAFGSEASRDRVDAGPVAVIAQSGSLGGAVTRQLLDMEVGVSYFISVGDGTVTDTADYLAHVIEDPQVRVVALYLEGARDGRRLGSVLREASARGIRVTALLGGMSAAGRSTTSSHTGRIITRPRLLAHLLEQQGVIVTRTVRELVAATRTLALSPLELPQPPEVAALGISGGMLALIVDACAETLGLAEFSTGTIGRLQAMLPGYTSAINPVDVTGAVVEDEALLAGTLSAVLADPGVGAVIAGLDNQGYSRLVRNADHFVSSARASGKPIVFALWDPPAGPDRAVERRLASAGVFVAEDPSEAAAPLRWLTRNPRQPTSPPVPVRAVDCADELVTWPGIVRLAEAIKARVPATWVLDPSDPVPVGELTEPPYVVKPVPNAVAHKSDRGLVHLHLYSAADVTSAVQEVRGVLGPGSPVLVQRMVTGVEVLVTAGRDPDWGPVLTLGSGGTLVELLDDVVHRGLPCDEPEVRAAVARLGVHRLLEGYRDIVPADVDALVKAVMGVQQVMLAHEGIIDEIELNPLIIAPKGQGAYVVDVLVTYRSRWWDSCKSP